MNKASLFCSKAVWRLIKVERDKYIANRSKDSTGCSFQNYDEYGNKYQENS